MNLKNNSTKGAPSICPAKNLKLLHNVTCQTLEPRLAKLEATRERKQLFRSQGSQRSRTVEVSMLFDLDKQSKEVDPLPKNGIFPAEVLTQELLQGSSLSAVRKARRLRNEHYRGAGLFELLALIQFRQPTELALAQNLARSLGPKDFYLRSDSSSPPPDLLIGAASWVLHYELPKYGITSRFNPGLRVQILASIPQELHKLAEPGPFDAERIFDGLMHLGIESPEAHAWIAMTLTREGDLSGAFEELKQALGQDRHHPMVQHAGHILCQQVSPKAKLDLFIYDERGTIRNFGVCPFPGQGFLMKEYLGYTGYEAPLLAARVPPLSSLDIWNWDASWNPKQPSTTFMGRVYTSDLVSVERREKEPSHHRMAA